MLNLLGLGILFCPALFLAGVAQHLNPAAAACLHLHLPLHAGTIAGSGAEYAVTLSPIPTGGLQRRSTLSYFSQMAGPDGAKFTTITRRRRPGLRWFYLSAPLRARILLQLGNAAKIWYALRYGYYFLSRYYRAVFFFFTSTGRTAKLPYQHKHATLTLSNSCRWVGCFAGKSKCGTNGGGFFNANSTSHPFENTCILQSGANVAAIFLISGNTAFWRRRAIAASRTRAL